MATLISRSNGLNESHVFNHCPKFSCSNVFPLNNSNVLFNNYNYDYSKRFYGTTCANCGARNHIYKTCNHPVISLGIICYTQDSAGEMRYLMVQRKDSLAYVEFIRGKYFLESRSYLLKLFSNMTRAERTRIQSGTFPDLWREMWKKDEHEKNKNFNREYNESFAKFNMLKDGYYLVNSESSSKILLDFGYIMDNSSPSWKETEWGFPKGRRSHSENDTQCAIREFYEETGIDPRYITINYRMKPLEEIFSGTNNTRYKHIYFLAKLNHKIGKLFDPENELQCREIIDAKFFTYEEAQGKIRETNRERKELLKRLHGVILKQSVVKKHDFIH